MTRSRPALLLLLLAHELPAHALQVVEAADGEAVFARISAKEPTRIAFEHGRVRRITGNAGEFVLEKDEERGEAYLRPAVPGSKPLNVFVSSEHSTVALLLQPADTPAESILIREARTAAPPAAAPGRSARHVRAAKDLLLAMAGAVPASGLEVREHTREFAFRPGLRLRLERTWLGAQLAGERYRLLPESPAAALPAEREFFRPGVVAVSLDSRTSAPASHVLVIRERRSDD